jgi:hypothetical protein
MSHTPTRPQTTSSSKQQYTPASPDNQYEKYIANQNNNLKWKSNPNPHAKIPIHYSNLLQETPQQSEKTSSKKQKIPPIPNLNDDSPVLKPAVKMPNGGYKPIDLTIDPIDLTETSPKEEAETE